MIEQDLSKGWHILQDVHDLGEELFIHKPDFDPHQVRSGFSEWEPLPRLRHLQLEFAENPYFGRELRHFNEHAWWYRLMFEVAQGLKSERARLRFAGVDYFCKVWLNRQYLGEHEGYFAPFEYDVGPVLRYDKPNLLTVKVWSPWDREVEGSKEDRVFAVIRDMVKGTYEHADTFVQRDVNPIGMWGQVTLFVFDKARFSEKPTIDVSLADDRETANLRIASSAVVAAKIQNAVLRCSIVEQETGARMAFEERREDLHIGKTSIDFSLSLERPKLWWTWDHGSPDLYRAIIEIETQQGIVAKIEQSFGIRTVKLHRSEKQTFFELNGKRVFLRGTTYFPDVYISNMHRDRYRRDLQALKRAGFNAIRIHVHVEKPELYDLCDAQGVAVIQDSDLNWVHPLDEVWKDRAVKVFGELIRHLRHHPSIIAWICINEPRAGNSGRGRYSKTDMLNICPGPQLAAEATRLDPDRPTIKGSGAWDDLESGDSHNYKGSLAGEETHYTDIYGQTEKLNTEFGFDAPPCAENLRRIPVVFRRLQPIVERIGELQYYQYRLLKYYIERYRITKYRPCSGYFQFMFIDLCPQSFYGVYDWWGMPKGGLKALEESNQPMGIFMEYRFEPVAVWIANDVHSEFPGCVAEWIVVDEKGSEITKEHSNIDVGADSLTRVSDLDFAVEKDSGCTVSLFLRNAKGDVLAKNVYRDPFRHPPHPEGHPGRMSHELGVRLYWA